MSSKKNILDQFTWIIHALRLPQTSWRGVKEGNPAIYAAIICNALLGFVIMFQSYDYISLFVPFFDIPVGLGSLFQGIASIYDRFSLSRLNKLFEEDQIFNYVHIN